MKPLPPGDLAIEIARPWYPNLATVPALALVLAGCASPDAPAAAPPPRPYPAALARLEERFQSALDSERAAALEKGVAYPGGIAAFVLPDGHVTTCATGFSDLEAGVPMRPDMVQPAGSIGKMFAATLTLLLARATGSSVSRSRSSIGKAPSDSTRSPSGPGAARSATPAISSGSQEPASAVSCWTRRRWRRW